MTKIYDKRYGSDSAIRQRLSDNLTDVVDEITARFGSEAVAGVLARQLLHALINHGASGVSLSVHKIGTVQVDVFVTSQDSVTWH